MAKMPQPPRMPTRRSEGTPVPGNHVARGLDRLESSTARVAETRDNVIPFTKSGDAGAGGLRLGSPAFAPEPKVAAAIAPGALAAGWSSPSSLVSTAPTAAAASPAVTEGVSDAASAPAVTSVATSSAAAAVAIAEPAPLPPVPAARFPRAPSQSAMARHAPVAAHSPSPRIPTVPPTAHVEIAPRAEPAAAPITTFPAPLADAKSRWAIFEQLGLVPKADVSQKTAKFLVSTYRALGFAVLTIIVVVLVGYIATSAFYFVSDSWIQPMVVSKSDERVLSVQTQLAEQENVRDRILADLAISDRTIAVQQTFQAEFARSIRADLTGRKAALSRVRALARNYAGARERIQRSNQAFAEAQRKRMAQEYAARLIDRTDVLSGKYQLAQITGSNLSLAERQAEYETRAAAMQSEAAALDAIITEKSGNAALSYDVLKIKQEFEMSRLETAKAIQNRELLKTSLARQEMVIDGLSQAPYLRAAKDGAHVAFVPYENLDGVAKGEPLYRCALGMIICRKVGAVKEVMAGEVTFKHPHREKILRGKMIELDLEKPDAAEEEVLFVGGRPLLI